MITLDIGYHKKRFMSDKQDSVFTCLSCQYWKHDGCFYGYTGWPSLGERCNGFSYDPGSDEHESDRG